MMYSRSPNPLYEFSHFSERFAPLAPFYVDTLHFADPFSLTRGAYAKTANEIRSVVVGWHYYRLVYPGANPRTDGQGQTTTAETTRQTNAATGAAGQSDASPGAAWQTDLFRHHPVKPSGNVLCHLSCAGNRFHLPHLAGQCATRNSTKYYT